MKSMMHHRTLLSVPALLAALSSSVVALAQEEPPPLTAAPPPDGKAIVEAPKAADAPKIEQKLDGASASVSMGGMLTTGNSRLLALSGNGSYETRFSNNGIGVSVLGNYGEGAPAGKPVQLTAENVQGRLRYDRYVVDEFAAFLINTGRHDRFQGLVFRYNLDPGVKYLFLKGATSALWGEAGYDFQYDIRRDADRVALDANGNPVLDAGGFPVLIDKTRADHSARLFAGFKHGFNKEVTLTAGVEYLQSVIDSTRYRLNFDTLFAAKVGGGLALGLGFSARYDHDPLPGKKDLDTSTIVSLIYAFSDPEPPKAKTCPCPDAPPPSQPEAAPEAAPAPTAAPPGPVEPPPAPSAAEPR